jgi:hypothetical protein
MIDINESIEDVEDVCKRLGFVPKSIKNLIQIAKMWGKFKKEYGSYLLLNAGISKVRISNFIEDIEKEYFPSLLVQTITVKIQAKDEDILRHIRGQIYDTFGVTEVTTHVKK